MSAQEVKNLRLRIRHTQRQFAYSLGVKRSYISRIENGWRQPRGALLAALRLLAELTEWKQAAG